MLDEREFLDEQARRAKARLRQTAQQASRELLAPLQLRPMVRRYPWWSLGGASAVGLLAGIGLAQVQRHHDDGAETGSDGGSKKGMVQKGLHRAGSHAWGWLRAAIGTMVMANLRAASVAAHRDGSNGHAGNGIGSER